MTSRQAPYRNHDLQQTPMMPTKVVIDEVWIVGENDFPDCDTTVEGVDEYGLDVTVAGGEEGGVSGAEGAEDGGVTGSGGFLEEVEEGVLGG